MCSSIPTRKGYSVFIKIHVLQHKNGGFSSKDCLYTDVDTPTSLDLTKMLNNEKTLKLMKFKTLLEIQNKYYWFPVIKKNLETEISRNPDKYIDILWVDGSRTEKLGKIRKKMKEREKKGYICGEGVKNGLQELNEIGDERFSAE